MKVELGDIRKLIADAEFQPSYTSQKKQYIQNPGGLQERVGPLRKRLVDDFEKRH